MEVRILTLQEIVTPTSNVEKNDKFILIKDRILLSPGNWNGLEFTKEEIKNAFLKTDWSDKRNFALIYDHEERASNWLGNVINLKFNEQTGELRGDLQIYDKEAGIKLTEGNAKLGISAKVLGVENEKGEFVNFTFNNFSVVYEPACKTAYINLSEQKMLEKITEIENKINILGEKFDRIIEEIKKSLRKAHPKWSEEKITSTAYATATARGISKEMSDDEEEEVDYEDYEEDEEAELAKVTNFEEVRKKRGMSVSEFYAIPRDPPSASKLPIYDAAHVRNALARFNQVKGVTPEEKEKARRKIKAAAKKFKIEVSEEFSDLEDLKGGNNSVKMNENEEQTQPVEAAETPVEEVKTDEVKTETTEASEELGSKLDKVISLLTSFEKRITKLEEVGLSKKTEVKTEELSVKAEPKSLAVMQPAKQTHALLGKQLSPGEMRLAEVLLKNATRT